MSDFQLRQLTSENKQDWDSFVASHDDATPYHKWAWMTAVTQAYRFKALPFALFEHQKIVALLPMILISRPLGKSSLCALPYCDVGGVLAETSSAQQNILEQVLKFSETRGWNSVDIRQGFNTIIEQVSEIQKVRMLLALPANSELLMSSFKSKLRSQIRKAEKNGLSATLGNDDKHLAGFYQVYSRNMRDLGSPAHSFSWFIAIIEAYGEDVIIANVCSEDIVIGAGLVLKNGSICSIPWASTNSDYNRLAPNMLLYWTLLAHAANSGFKLFDFGRSTLGEGTYKFKQQWGAKPALLDWQNYQNGELVNLPNEANKPSTLRKHVETLWRKLPVDMATFFGSKIRKYITL